MLTIGVKILSDLNFFNEFESLFGLPTCPYLGM